MRSPLPRALALFALLGCAAQAMAGSPAATLVWPPEDPGSAGSLLLVLERETQGWRLIDERRAEVRPKLRRSERLGEGPVFALFDAEGGLLAAGWLDVPEVVHGPELDEDGAIRCVAHPLERQVVALRLPSAGGTAELRLYEAAEFSPDAPAALASALRGRPEDAGFRAVAVFALGEGGPP